MSPLGCLWSLALVVAVLGAQAKPSQEAPVAYRCDRLRMTRAHQGGTCEGNVVLQQNDLLLCCEKLVGTATPEGTWQSFVCEGDVRGAQGDLLVWAGHATFDATQEKLVLTANPRTRRGVSTLWGQRISVSTHDGALDVDTPRGHFLPQPSPTSAPARARTVWLDGTSLPTHCPLPSGPREAAPSL